MFTKFKKLIVVIVFLALIAGPSISWLILSNLNEHNSNIMEVLDFDLNEKRNKATLSETFNINTFAGEYEKYYNDRLPFRSILITLKRNIDSYIETPYNNTIEPLLINKFGKKINANLVDVDEASDNMDKAMDEAVAIFLNHKLRDSDIDPYNPYVEYPVKYLNNSKVIIGQSNWLYLGEGNIPYYLGTNTFATSSEIPKYIDQYIKLDKLCKEVGKRLFILICPEKEEIYPEYMPTMNIVNERERVLDIRDYINENTKLNYIYPKEQLIPQKKNYLLYKKYDSHWGSAGAYIAYNELKTKMGFDTIPISDLSLEREKVTDADLIYYANASIDNLPETFKYNFIDYKNENTFKYIFVNNDKSYDSFTSHCENGDDRKVFLVGDSFREAFTEFFVKDFKEVYCNTFVNMSKPFIKEEVKRADDIVFCLVERNEGIVLPDLCKMTTRILNEYKDEIRKINSKVNK